MMESTSTVWICRPSSSPCAEPAEGLDRSAEVGDEVLIDGQTYTVLGARAKRAPLGPQMLRLLALGGRGEQPVYKPLPVCRILDA